MAHSGHKFTHEHGRHTARQRYACGGKMADGGRIDYSGDDIPKGDSTYNPGRSGPAYDPRSWGAVMEGMHSQASQQDFDKRQSGENNRGQGPRKE